MKINIVDRGQSKVDAFSKCMVGMHDVNVYWGDIFDFGADAVVSPANSFGYMDGGIDEVYAKRWYGIQTAVQKRIQKEEFGELLVGRAFSINIGHKDVFDLYYLRYIF